MKQPISGVAPSELEEVTVMTVFPSIAYLGLGRQLGRWFSIRWPDVYIFRLGNLIALLSIPIALAMYFYRLAPSFFGTPVHGTFYQITNRRICELRNEINLGDGSTALRLLCALAGFVPIFIIWCLFQQFAFGWTVMPSSTLSGVVALVCLVGAGLSLIPVFAPVPVPRFKFGAVTKSVDLDRFNKIDIVVQPGQEWYHAGDLVFMLDGVETFRLDGVSRPEAFRTTCMHSNRSFVGVKKARQRELAHA